MELAKIFSNHLILQRNKPVSVWGFSAVGEVVLTLINGMKHEVYRVHADENGEFCFNLKPHTGSYDAYTMIVENGAHVQRVDDVRFGEVFLTMGQSNMAYGVGAMVNCTEILNEAHFSPIACFDVYEAYQQEDGSIFRPSKPENDFAGDWGLGHGSFDPVCGDHGAAPDPRAAYRGREPGAAPLGHAARSLRRASTVWAVRHADRAGRRSFDQKPAGAARDEDHVKRVSQDVPSIKQVLPAEKQKEYGRFVRTPFLYRQAVVMSLVRLSSLWFLRLESPSAFPDKHCLCGHKSYIPFP